MTRWDTPYTPNPDYAVEDITPTDLLYWQIAFARDGALPPVAQRRLLEYVLHDLSKYRGPVVAPVNWRPNP